MKKIIFYLLFMGLIYLAALAFLLSEIEPHIATYRIGLTCSVIGGLGGCLYCLRGIYLNISVRNQWDPRWQVWYYIRPIVSAGCGGVSYLFLKAGLLVLEAGTKPDASEIGFYALAFIAGFNVDKFIKKIEEIGEAVFGIDKSRSSAPDRNKEKERLNNED